MRESEGVNSGKNFQKANFRENLIILPFKGICYGAIGGMLAIFGLIIIDGGWEPLLRKYIGFLGLAGLGFSMAIVYGIKNYFMLKKLYSDQKIRSQET